MGYCTMAKSVTEYAFQLLNTKLKAERPKNKQQQNLAAVKA